ncbi:FG-GAP repeat protein [Phytomonospora sp. NPDC050363]|uniref:FG-GAP repeat protein n=1 Tax=Phytomonospora sp. NPDC050363 TaxID=3155642 RepID=UPI0033FEFC0F
MKRIISAAAVALTAASAALTVTATPAAAGQFHVDEVIDDFNCDGLRDEVYLASHYDVGDARGAGAIIIYYSSGTVYEQTISQNTPGVPGTAETGDSFGQVYAATDFNGDGCDDLVVSAPYEAVDGADEAGLITVINGSPNGLVPAQSVAYTQNTPGVPGGAEFLDGFGATLAAGKTSGGQPYLLVGSPGESVGSKTAAGSVYYLRGGVWRAFHQDSPGVAGTAEHWDEFGSAIAGGDRYFVVGAYRENLSGRSQAGQVHVFGHKIVGGVPDPLATISQDSAGVSGTAESDDYFGQAVAVVPYQPAPGASIGALVGVGVPGEALGGDDRAGMAHVFAVTPTGRFTELADINQDSTGVADSTQEDDRFGEDLVFGIEGGATIATPSTAVLAVAVPWEDYEVDQRSGAIQVFTDVRRPGTGDLVFRHDDGSVLDGHTGATTLGSTPTELLLGGSGAYFWRAGWGEVLG